MTPSPGVHRTVLIYSGSIPPTIKTQFGRNEEFRQNGFFSSRYSIFMKIMVKRGFHYLRDWPWELKQ